MATQVQFRRGTTAETASFAGAIGEVTVDTTKKTVVTHDGSTLGGFPLLREDGTNSLLSVGSLSVPSLKFANSTNTGFYSPSAGTFALVASGTAALVADTSGNLSCPGNVTTTGRLTSASFVPTGSTVPTNGLYLSAANTVSIATNSLVRLSVNATGDVTITGGLTIGSTFSATSFVPTGSSIPTNGMYLPSANTVSIATNGAQQFTIDPSGNVTITGGFTIGGAFSATNFSPTGSSIPTNGMYLPSTNTLSFSTAGVSRLTISSSGNLNIGGTVTVTGSSTSGSFIPTSSSAPTNGVYLSAANTLAFATNSALRLSINSTGNVTIASGSLTTSSGSNTAQSFIPTSSSVPTNGMYLSGANTVAFATNSVLRLTLESSGGMTLASGSLSVSSGTINAGSFIPTSSSIPSNGLYLPAANSVSLSTNSNERFAIDSSGNVTVVSGTLTTSSGSNIAQSFIPTGSVVPANGLYLPAANTVALATNTIERLRIDSNGKLLLGGASGAVVTGALYYRLNSGVVGLNGTSDQSVFGVGVTLASSTVYVFEIVFVLTKTSGTNSHNISTLFGGTAAINNIVYTGTGATVNGSLPTSASSGDTNVRTPMSDSDTTAVVVAPNMSNAVISASVQIRGTVSIDRSGTFIPQYRLSSSPGGAYTTVAGSYIMIYPIGASGSNSSAGTWS